MSASFPPQHFIGSCCALLVGMVSLACTSIPLSPTGTQADDVVIARSQFGETVTVKTGQTLSIPRPADFPEWQVDYANNVLEALTAPDKMRSPGPDGWRFKAIAAGETDLAFTVVMVGGPPPPRFVVTVRVQ